MLYKVFIDDSGNNDYESPYAREHIDFPPETENYLDYWRKNYFVLTGVRIPQSALKELNKEINDLKIKTFKTNKIEIKSDWLRNPHQRKKHYVDTFNVTESELNAFGQAIFELIHTHKDDLKIISIVYDKRYFGDEKRQTIEWNPLAKTAQILFERIQYAGAYNIVVFDQMEDSLRINHGKNGLIIKVLKDKIGMDKVYVENFTAIVDIKPSISSRENFLQIADICGYAVYRQFVHYGREWCSNKLNGASMPVYEYFGKLRCNFLNKNNNVRGVGLVCVPDLNKNNWDILKGCEEEYKKAPQE